MAFVVAECDWTDLKTEYASTDISYRKLADKRGISFNTLKDHARKVEWAKARKEYTDKVTKKTLQKMAEKPATIHLTKWSICLSGTPSDRNTPRTSRLVNY